MSTRTITGNLAANPEIVQAGSISITKLRVIENTGEYRQGRWTPHPDATTHFVEAKFELGENTAATFHKGDPAIVIEARNIGPDLNRAVAQVRRTSKPDDEH